MSSLPKPSALRGAALRERMLLAAKAVLLETGFERASMDRIAAEAGTTKRSLYAHFGSKEDLLQAVFGLVLDLQLHHLGQPADYAPANGPEAALTRFCVRFLETVLATRPLRLFRLAIAETDRFPQGGTVRLHEALFESVEARIAQFLGGRGHPAPADAARALLAWLLYPRFTRALFGAGEPATTFSAELGAAPAVAPESVRALVVAALAGTA